MNLREKPSTSAKVITQIPDGEIIKMIVKPSYYEDLDGKGQHPWIKVRYNEYEGYVYSKFTFSLRALLYPKTEMNKLPKLNYYEISKIDSSYYQLKKVEAKKKYSNIEDSKYEQINCSENAVFIYATIDTLREGKLDFLGGSINKYLIIKPGTSKVFKSMNGNEYKLVGSGYSNDNGYACDYELYYGVKEKSQTSYSLWNISEGIQVGTESGYEILWFGDIDQDSVPDLILQGCSTYACTDVLLLSSQAEKGKPFKVISRNTFDGEY